MALVLFNIGWMKYYRGQNPSDLIVNGGSYVRDNKTGGEIENFLPDGGWYYGYVQPSGSGVNLERLGAAPGATHADNVTIVFTATRPGVGSVVVGWYRDARVWRDQQQRRNHIYFAKARKKNCTLLRIDERVFPVHRAGKPRGTWGMGQSNIRYVDKADEDEEFVRMVLKYTENPSSIDVPGSPQSGRARGGVSRQSDPYRRGTCQQL